MAEEIKKTLGQKTKRGFKKLVFYGIGIYAIGVAADSHLRNDSIKNEILSLKDQQINSLLQNDKPKYETLNTKINNLNNDAKFGNILWDHSLAWPYTTGKAIYEEGNKLF